MKVLVIGKGGREHAIVDKVSESQIVSKIYALPGNVGMSKLAELVNIDVYNNQLIVDFVIENNIELVIIGPEISLKSGLSDILEEAGILVLGASTKAAQLETSKNFAKKFMKKYRIQTADYEFFTKYDEAIQYVKAKSLPIVIKFDGLAAGKGVHIIEDQSQAVEVLQSLLVEKSMGDIGVVIEDFIQGDEFTLMALVNGSNVYPFQTSRDFKRIYDNDEGPNTGGMGSITPYNSVDKETYDQAVEVLQRTAECMIDEGIPYKGVLYGGFMVNEDGLYVIEYNARFGDPETETALNNIESDFVQNILDLLSNEEVNFKFKNQVSAGLVLSSPGYPRTQEDNIDLVEYFKLPFKVFVMGAKKDGERIVSSGGRVLFILNQADTSVEAYNEMYAELAKVKDNCLHYRKDLTNY
ncbi:phosphoribosylamine--glycine ligase [Mycoplasma sp. P36-A1]|uniref:phosphoribosylamine--glycine ligase n=1 Tax=Mycoplasma sp. P36-A1 TaxID=3252900 RepID=UPI003C2FCA82